MRSFISSFERIRKVRHVPAQPWGRVMALSVALLIVFTLGWEARVRALGYTPSINDTPGHWAFSRAELAKYPDSIVIAGASRIRFALDHQLVSEAFGGARVVNLAINGSTARPQLSHLAADSSFTGIVLCDYVPGIFWAPAGPPMEKSLDWIAHYYKRTPSDRVEQLLSFAPQSLFAFIEMEDLALSPMLRGGIQLPNREGVRLPPRMPPYFGRIDISRRQFMWEKMESDAEFQQEVQEIWRVLFSMGRSLPPDLLGMLIGETAQDIQRIRDRGGDVIFIQFPATGWLHEFESQTYPRDEYFDRLLEVTGSFGVHFEDYPELAGYDCPEWSHLSAGDAVKFSRDLMAIIRDRRPPAVH